MSIEPGKIVKNLIPSESVVIDKIQQMGTMFSLHYTGVNTKIANSKIISKEAFEQLEVISDKGSFNFEGDPLHFTLFAEAERINAAYQFDPLFAVNCSIVDPLPHQVEAVYRYLLPQPKIRFLLADDTGAGKTIMTGLLIKELMMRGLVERVLIVTPGGLTKQWQEDELGIKFNINFTLVNRDAFTSDPNVFNTAQRIVTSIDFISREDIIKVAGNYHWDLIVFDEAHKLSAYEYGTRQYLSKRYIAADILSKQCEHLLLLTATPHRGRNDTFKKLLQLLDEDIFVTEEIATNRVKDLENSGVNKFFIRRLKEDMKDWEGNPLYTERFTKTVSYELTPEEKELYDAVTQYLSKRKEEASESRNIHVSLALTVMQRRLVSSIFAIKKTLFRRWQSLQAIVDELNKNPNLWSQKHKLEAYDVDNLDEFEELEDDERESLESILADPKKFKLFTTAKSTSEIQKEAQEVKRLYDMAETLYNTNQEEQKYRQLSELLKTHKVIDGNKLVIFTEHKDTLFYLEERLRKSGGYEVATIYGGKSVDERRSAQLDFSKNAHILIATDAAGEGINLQFCRLLINWDIPWNPNRLEQRMGRIHRYGQKENVLVLNMVANNTKEGQVLERLLKKIDVIRESIGDDRVYDVIQDVFENIKMDAIVDAVLNGKENEYTQMLHEQDSVMVEKFKEKIDDSDKLAHSSIDYKDARLLKDDSDEKRLQPIYIKLFFEKAFKALGGNYTEIRENIFQINQFPDSVAQILRTKYNIFTDKVKLIKFCFDKQVFLEYQQLSDLGTVHYINPGNPVFDSLIEVVRLTYRDDMLKGTILISPEDKNPYFAFFVRSQITDNRPTKGHDSIADERLLLVFQDEEGNYQRTSAAKLLDMHPPTSFAKLVAPPEIMNSDAVIHWSFEHITIPQWEETQQGIASDAEKRKEYLETAFTQLITDLSLEINALQGKILLGDKQAQEKTDQKHERIQELKHKKEKRLQQLELMQQLSPKEPAVLGCAYVLPLTQVEYHQQYGMSRDDEVEAIAMEVAMNYEISEGRNPEDVAANNEGYDIRSIDENQIKRYIEVKGRSAADGSVMLTENEKNRLEQLGDSAWLYIVIKCKSTPSLFCIQNPGKKLNFEMRSRGVQYFLPMQEWQQKIN